MVKSSYSSIAGEERVFRATMLFNKESKYIMSYSAILLPMVKCIGTPPCFSAVFFFFFVFLFCFFFFYQGKQTL